MLLELFCGFELAATTADWAVLCDFRHVVYELVEQVSQSLNLFKFLICGHVLTQTKQS